MALSSRRSLAKSPPESHVQLRALTGLRFFLASWVILFHVAGYYGVTEGLSRPVYSVLGTGYISVGMFFVLSGFVLAYNYSLVAPWSRQELTNFIISRISRIYPAYFLGLILIFPIIAFGDHGIIHHRSVSALAREAITAVLNWTLLQAWIPQTALTWNFPGWSLSVEAFFYVCFPFIGLWLWRLTTVKSLLAAALALWALVTLVPVIATGVPFRGCANWPAVTAPEEIPASWPVGEDVTCRNFVKFNPILRIPEFCAGIIAARAYNLLKRRGHYLVGRGHLLSIPAIVIMLLVLANASSLHLLPLHNGLLLPLYLGLILGLALGGGIHERVLSTSVLVFLGNASYSMYIVHIVVQSWMTGLAKHIFSERLGGAGWMTVYLAIVILVSSIVFKAVEEPLRRSLKKRLAAIIRRAWPKSAWQTESAPLSPGGASVPSGMRP